MYAAHDEGLLDLGNGKGRTTVFQKRVYFMAKAHWDEEAREDTNGGVGSATRGTQSVNWSRDT